MTQPCPICGEVDCHEGFHAPSFEQTLESAGLKLYCTFGPDKFFVSPTHKAFVSYRYHRPVLSMIACLDADRMHWVPARLWEDPSQAAREIPEVMRQVLQ